jgi:outer membrane immunogenic protein
MFKEEIVMKDFVLGSLAALSLASVSAQAADMPARTMPTKALPMAVASWTGFYIGAGGGYGMSNTDHTSSLAGAALVQPAIAGKGWFGTVQVGGDYQFADRWVAGAFGDFDFSDIKGTASELVSITSFPLSQRNAYAAGARIGYLVTPQILSYVDGGYSHANFNGGSLSFATAPFTATGLGVPNQGYDGYFLGGGTEVMIANGWSVKSEYRYARYGSATVTVPTVTPIFTETLKPSVQTVRTTLVYKFN